MADVEPRWWEDRSGWQNFRWKAAPDDVIGGACVLLEAEIRTPAEGAVPIAQFMTEDVAQHVADCHNTWLVLYKGAERAKAEGK